MLLRVALFVMLAFGIAGAGATAWFLLAAHGTAPEVSAAAEPVPTKSMVLVAAHALRAGSLMKPEDLASREVATAEVPNDASRDTPQARGALTGSMIRRNLGEAQLILPADVVHPGDHGFLAAVLGPDMRAITVAVDVVSGTAGLIWPGDRIDLILTQQLEDPTLGAGRRIAAETVLSDIRVIAVDQQMVHGQVPDGTVVPANRTATLEVTASQAERVLVAERLGKLALSVLSADRPAAGQATAAPPPPQAVQPPGVPQAAASVRVSPEAGKPLPGRQAAGVTWARDVSPALGSGEVRTAPVMMHIFQGGAEGKEFHF